MKELNVLLLKEISAGVAIEIDFETGKITGGCFPDFYQQ